MLLLDSHVLPWYYAGSGSLGKDASRAIARADEKLEVRVSSLTFFELENAFRVKRLRGISSVQAFRRELLELGLGEIPPNGEVCLRAADFRASLPDEFDALIVATADVHGFDLVTADTEILAWRGRVKRIDARK